jgi:hypothetical protein
MMTAAIWFGLAAIALVGAIVLLYFDRVQRQRTGHVRQVWAKSQAYTFVSVEPSLAATWHRGAMAKLSYLTAVDVVSGNRRGEKFVLFDLEDAATLVAVRRKIGSDIDIDLRLKTAAPPKDADLELLGAIGDRVVFATNPDIARHAVDQRMVAFIETLPDSVQQLWSEGNWTLGLLPVGAGTRDWEAAIDAVLRLSGLLHVLPPVANGADRGRPLELEGHDPGRPRPRPASDQGDEYLPDRDERYPDPDDAEFADAHHPADPAYDPDSRYSGAQFGDPLADGPRPGDQPSGGRRFDEPHFAEPRFDDSHSDDSGFDDSGFGDSDFEDRHVDDTVGESEPERPRRPQLAVVPDPRTRVRRNWPPAEEEEYADAAEVPVARDLDDTERPEGSGDELPERPGGPFHPGFRPYQGPAPR